MASHSACLVMDVVSRRLLSSRYELYAHPNHHKSTTTLTFYHYKSTNLLFTINERFRSWIKGGKRRKEATASALLMAVVVSVLPLIGQSTRLVTSHLPHDEMTQLISTYLTDMSGWRIPKTFPSVSVQ